MTASSPSAQVPALKADAEKWTKAYHTPSPSKLKDDPLMRNTAVNALVTAAGLLDTAAKKPKLY